VNCMFLPSANLTSKNARNLVGRWPHAMHMP